MLKDMAVSVCPQYTVKPMRGKKPNQQLKDPFFRLEVMNLINIFLL